MSTDTLPARPVITYTVDTVLNRMYNWKFRSALEQAVTIKDFPEPAIALLRTLAEEFDNDGWMEGPTNDRTRDLNEQTANILGYAFDDDKEYWVPRTSK